MMGIYACQKPQKPTTPLFEQALVSLNGFSLTTDMLVNHGPRTRVSCLTLQKAAVLIPIWYRDSDAIMNKCVNHRSSPRWHLP